MAKKKGFWASLSQELAKQQKQAAAPPRTAPRPGTRPAMAPEARQRQAARDALPTWPLRTGGRQAVVGEQHYRPALAAIVQAAGAFPAGELKTVAVLVLEPDNPYDRDAIKVMVGGATVGYIPADDTGIYRPVLEHLAASNWNGECPADIRWRPEIPDTDYGVWLDVFPGFSLPGNRPEPGSFLLPGGNAVTVTGEEEHQEQLAPMLGGQDSAFYYGTLGWCEVAKGKYAGQRAVEVRLNGQRVGQLTAAMSDRYSEVLQAADVSGVPLACGILLAAEPGKGVQAVVDAQSPAYFPEAVTAWIRAALRKPDPHLPTIPDSGSGGI